RHHARVAQARRPGQHRDRHPGQACGQAAGQVRSFSKTRSFSMPVRQTQSYLRSLFARRGIALRHRMGQNFLIDLNIHELIVEEARVGPDDVILEIGPGAGALTALMAGRGAMIVAVELDPEMAKLTQEAVAGFPSVRVLNTDALANKNTLSPIMIESVDEALASAPSRVFKLVANLPYNVATPVFWPRPKVESTVVAIRPDAARRAALDVAWFHEMVRKLFLHRRKNLRHVLSGIWRDHWTKTEVEVWLESLGIDGQLRAEALGVEQFRTLAYALKKRLV